MRLPCLYFSITSAAPRNLLLLFALFTRQWSHGDVPLFGDAGYKMLCSIHLIVS